MEKKQMNIYQKLAKIQDKINGLAPDKKSFGFNYVSGTKLLSFIKPLMKEYNLILKQEIISIDNERQDYFAGKDEKRREISEILTKVMMKFTWVDCDTGDKDENLFGANGQNGWDKGIGSALTYGERYFLMKYFHIATDQDDIDQPKPLLADEMLKGCDKWEPKQKQAVIDKYDLTDKQLKLLK
jgi:hypothetical protein